MRRLNDGRKGLVVFAIPDDIDNKIITNLLNNLRFMNYEHNKNNQKAKDACWTRGDDSSIYTFITYDGKRTHAHRVSYEIFTGKKLLNFGCHHCDVKACINPNHIFDGTARQNYQDAQKKHRMYNINLNKDHRIDAAEKRFRLEYPNQVMNVSDIKDDLAERLEKLVGTV